MNADGLPVASPSAALIGVVLVGNDFDARTPIGGLSPLLRHALALQHAGAEAVVLLRASAKAEVPEILRVPRLTVPLLNSLPRHGRALIVRADVTAHRALPPRLAALPLDVDQVVVAGDAGAAIAVSGELCTQDVIEAFARSALPLNARNEPLIGEGAFAEFVLVAASPAERKAATARHLRSLRKPTGGVLENLYMRPLSMHMTGALCKTSITPNTMSVVTLGVALLAGALIALPDPRFSIAGGLLHMFMRVVDCIDGELARLRYQSSRFGEWLDTIGDGIGMAALIAGTTVHAMRHDPQILMVGVVGVVAWMLVQGLQIAGAMSVAETGTFHRVQWGHRTKQRTRVERFVANVEMALRIDAISTYYGLAVMFGAHQAMLYGHTAVALIACVYFAAQVLKLRARRA